MKRKLTISYENAKMLYTMSFEDRAICFTNFLKLHFRDGDLLDMNSSQEALLEGLKEDIQRSLDIASKRRDNVMQRYGNK